MRVSPTVVLFWQRAVARVLIALMLMTQLVIASYACPSLLSADPPAEAGQVFTRWFATGLTSVADGSMDASDAGSMPWPESPLLCGEHCKVGQQSDLATTIQVPTPLIALRYVIPAVPPLPAPPRRPVPAELDALVAAAPPHAILHCVLRT